MTPTVRIIPPLPLPSGDAGHRFRDYGGHYADERDAAAIFHRERSPMRRLMDDVHCELMRDAGDLLAAAHYRQPPITENQVRRIMAVLVLHFGLDCR